MKDGCANHYIYIFGFVIITSTQRQLVMSNCSSFYVIITSTQRQLVMSNCSSFYVIITSTQRQLVMSNCSSFYVIITSTQRQLVMSNCSSFYGLLLQLLLLAECLPIQIQIMNRMVRFIQSSLKYNNNLDRLS